MYLTGPYEGAPFGLSIAVPAVAGPFNLGTVVVGARLEVNPSTAALTIVSDPAAAEPRRHPAAAQDGQPEHRPPGGFVFNPTSCQPTAIEGTLTSSDGATAPVSSRFQAAELREGWRSGRG